MEILKPAAIFSDHMVLQRGKPINVWGVCDYGKAVTVSIEGHESSTTEFERNWKVNLEPFNEYGGPYEMTVTDGNNTVTFTDIYIGEVWLAGGQSNMELELRNCETGAAELENITTYAKDVRFYYTRKIAYMDDFFFAHENASSWETCESPDVGLWSAVGYYCGKKLAAELGCKVGIIGCNWGGTSASAWISRQRLISDIDTKTYVDELEAAMEGRSFESYCKDLEDYHRWEAQWQPKIDEFYRDNPEGLWDDALEYAGQCLWPEPLGPKSPFRASGVYETMIKRVCPYTLAGFLYYQGESDDHKPEMYAKLLAMLIGQWRDDWNDASLPFILVQLPMFLNRGDIDHKNWCLIREAQAKVAATVANVGMASILDKGEYGNIHPTAKEPVGERLAMQALEKVYGKLSAKKANGPIYKSSYPTAGGMKVEFNFSEDMYVLTEEGESRTSGELRFFELAGVDGIYHPAKAEFSDGNSIYVYSDDVPNPQFVRYQWVNYGPVELFGANGIPAAPFRSSSFEREVINFKEYTKEY